MSLKRRKFLLFGITLGGIGVAGLAHQGLSKNHLPQQSFKVETSEFLSANQEGILEPLPKKDVRIVVISDLNSQYGATTYEPQVDKAIAMIPGWEPDLVLCGGDMIAGQKRSLSKGQITAMWAAFDEHISAPLRQVGIPFGFTIGNHDGSGAIVKGEQVFAGERELASKYWNSHDPGLNFGDRGNFPFYYSFQQKGIFYLVWDASNYLISSQQLAWVEKTLQSKEAQQAKMRIAIGHMPLYPVAIGRNKVGEYLADGDKLRSLLERYNVHTYISGHHHAYYPGKRGKLELLHTGALGSGPRQLINSKIPPRNTITIVDIDLDSASTRYTTYDMKTLAVINIHSLPRLIVWDKNWVLRRDIQVENLTQSEKESIN
ncbi:metallophosphoesterase family protein [Merismopedia glauca]|uniref:Metallophosphoesterase n=1 Tax=Merismopedia glauca CCAP 1448/3 TaxID=1296344 RepID=A0A2T1C7B1_9CYAN|nr:metallophosphoesterase [Merismopedia glauca]PSB04027.1 metallophosphoesterase [Merismopedia glauca CCAP 1448/3]